jgi:hypothetical protein
MTQREIKLPTVAKEQTSEEKLGQLPRALEQEALIWTHFKSTFRT